MRGRQSGGGPASPGGGTAPSPAHPGHARRQRLRRIAHEELDGVPFRMMAATAVSSLLPPSTCNRVRALILRLAGVAIGAHTLIGGTIRIAGIAGAHRRLVIGDHVWINRGCFLDMSGEITIGDHVAIGQQVTILTQSHVIGDRVRRAGDPVIGPVRIGDGCWIGANATVLPGVVIGPGAIVAAAAVVTRDVPADTLVAGIPARPVRVLDGDDPRPGADAAVGPPTVPDVAGR